MCSQAHVILLILSLMLLPLSSVKTHAEDTDDILDTDTVQSLVDSDPEMHFKLKDGTGKQLSMNKWTKGNVTIFVLYEKTNPIKTIIASATRTVPASFKNDDPKIRVVISPEYTEYKLQNKTVMKYVPTEIGGGDKPAEIKAKATIGADEYDVLEAYTVIKSK